MARPSSPPLSRTLIVESATALIDSQGLEAFSTRSLASALGVRGPSLYNHVSTKDEILEAVVDAITAQVDATSFLTDDWRSALRTWAISYHDTFAKHPNVVPILARGPARRPAALAMADIVYGGLVDAGWPPARATHVGALMRYFVIGSVSGSFAEGFPADRELYEGKYPHLSTAHRLAENQVKVDESAFRLGLDALIVGLAEEYERVATSKAASQKR